MKSTATLGILALVTAAACGGGSKQSATAEATTPATTTEAASPEAAEPPAPVTGADAARAKSTFAMYPKGVSLVAGASAAQLRQSALWSHIEPLIASRVADLAAVEQACQFDPVKAIEAVEVAMDMDGSTDEMVMVLKGNVGRAAIERCLEKASAGQGQTMTITNDGVVSSYSDGTTTFWGGWPDDNTMIFGDPTHDRAWVEARLAGTDSIRDDDAFMNVLGEVDTKATAWLAMVDEAGQLAMLGGMLGGRAPTALYAWLSVTDTAKAEIGLVFPAEGDANVASTALQTMLDQLKADPTMGALVGSARVGVYGNNAVLELELDQQQLAQLLALVGTLPI